MGESAGSGLKLLAIVTSRPEALVIASMLEANGILVDVDGAWHASVDPISIALGGHRIRVAAQDYLPASDLIREMGLPDSEIAYEGGRAAIARFLAVFVGCQVFFIVPALIAGAIPLTMLAQLPLSVLGVPVDPRSRNDYLLAEPQ